MGTEAIALGRDLTPFEQLSYARQIIQIESRALAIWPTDWTASFAAPWHCFISARGT